MKAIGIAAAVLVASIAPVWGFANAPQLRGESSAGSPASQLKLAQASPSRPSFNQPQQPKPVVGINPLYKPQQQSKPVVNLPKGDNKSPKVVGPSPGQNSLKPAAAKGDSKPRKVVGPSGGQTSPTTAAAKSDIKQPEVAGPTGPGGLVVPNPAVGSNPGILVSKPAVVSDPAVVSNPAIGSNPGILVSKPAVVSDPAVVSNPAIGSNPGVLVSKPAVVSDPAVVSIPAVGSNPVPVATPTQPGQGAAAPDIKVTLPSMQQLNVAKPADQSGASDIKVTLPSMQQLNVPKPADQQLLVTTDPSLQLHMDSKITTTNVRSGISSDLGGGSGARMPATEAQKRSFVVEVVNANKNSEISQLYGAVQRDPDSKKRFLDAATHADTAQFVIDAMKTPASAQAFLEAMKTSASAQAYFKERMAPAPATADPQIDVSSKTTLPGDTKIPDIKPQGGFTEMPKVPLTHDYWIGDFAKIPTTGPEKEAGARSRFDQMIGQKSFGEGIITQPNAASKEVTPEPPVFSPTFNPLVRF